MKMIRRVPRETPCTRAGTSAGSRGRAVCTIAAMRDIAMSSVDPDDPMIDELMRWPAHVLDCVRTHYRLAIHGAPSRGAIHAVMEGIAVRSLKVCALPRR